MRTVLAFLGTGALCGALGFVTGRWTARVPVLEVGTATPRREVDLSPSNEVRTVVAPKVRTGRPTAPPAAVPEAFGHQVSTTTTELLTGGTFHAATFATLDGRALELRTVEWMETPTGRSPLGEAETTAAPLRLVLPPAPLWGLSLLVPVGEGRPKPGVHVQWTPGPFIVGGGQLMGHTFLELGARW